MEICNEFEEYRSLFVKLILHFFQDDECERDGNNLYAKPFQRFFLRKPSVLEPTPPNLSLIRTDLLLQLKEDISASEAINNFVES